MSARYRTAQHSTASHSLPDPPRLGLILTRLDIINRDWPTNRSFLLPFHQLRFPTFLPTFSILVALSHSLHIPCTVRTVQNTMIHGGSSLQRGGAAFISFSLSCLMRKENLCLSVNARPSKSLRTVCPST